MSEHLKDCFKVYEQQVRTNEPLGELRRAFFAGAAAFHSILLQEIVGNLKILHDLNQELVNFTEEMRKEIGNNRQ